jgi:hypothetical protein
VLGLVISAAKELGEHGQFTDRYNADSNKL